LRIFVREDGRPYPTILFWLFFVPVLIILLAGGCAVLNRRAEQTRVAGALTGTPPPAETAAPSASATPRAATLVPTATQFVYDDPGDWEFVERTDPTGKKYLDLQDWQREQVWHAFEEFWNLYNRNEGGLPDWATIEPHIRGSFLELVRGNSTGLWKVAGTSTSWRRSKISPQGHGLESPAPGMSRSRSS
jgi:hypothetical protein